MNQALNPNELATLSTVLLSTLDEGIFFGKLSSFILDNIKEHKVLIFKVYQDGATQLVADSGKALDSLEIHEKGQGLASYVARIKRAYYSNSVQTDPLFSGLDIPKEIKSELCIPVMADGMVICTINIQSIEEDRQFGEGEIAKITEILSHLKSPIGNMKLYLLAKHLNRQLLQKIEDQDKEIVVQTQTTKSGTANEVAIIGHSKQMIGLVDLIKKVSKEDYPILFEGKSGTGKKLLGRKLHSISARSENKCILVHCNSENDEALDIELFGKDENPGVLEQAQGGTIILKEVSELSEAIQSKLLLAITCGKIRRVGSQKSISINIRFVSTSRKSLEQQVEEGSFSEDLYYRLNTIKIRVPQLSERKEDMKLLASFFLNSNRDESEKKVITNAAIDALCSYNWPGNLQELKSIMERTYILSDGKYIDIADLPSLKSSTIVEEVEEEINFEEVSLFELEKKHICLTLDHLAGNKTRAAKSLGITVKTLYNKLHNYGLVATKS